MRAVAGIVFCFVLSASSAAPAAGQTGPLSVRVADSSLARWPEALVNDPGKPEKWAYEQGVLLKGIEDVWRATAEGKYFAYMQRGVDHFVGDDGTIRTYKAEDYSLDNVLTGRVLLTLYNVTGQEKYRRAAALLREQLRTQPRTNDGGFWHKKIYPSQMWLDGLYMAEPFYAEYAATFHEEADFEDIARQFLLMEQHARDAKTGLLYHGWDESRRQRWADPRTGRSPNFWGRAVGWYALALVDTLDYFPQDHPRRAELLAVLRRLASAIARYQDAGSGLWYQVLDRGGAQGNYLESSASCMFVYALAKGARRGYLPGTYLRVARRGFEGVTRRFIETDSAGRTNVKGIVSVGGLGGNPYRDGSYRYYLSEKVVANDPKGVGAFLMASTEMETDAALSFGEGETVALDSYFNDEVRKDATGRLVSWHYKWEEEDNGGFSFWGRVFGGFGVKTETLREAPTRANLKGASIYIIADPDTPQESENPHYVEQPDIEAITDWVRAGGVLVLMGNDKGNAEFEHFNRLAARFGIQFNEDSRNRVQGNDFDAGKIVVAPTNPVFKTARNLYLKEISTLAVRPPARPLIVDKGDVIMATARFGRGAVFAVGDPWLYNEYVDGRKLPPSFENFKAAQDLTRWLVGQARAGREVNSRTR
jgi:unsaturated rhamnogalacturonyl hydrolase